MTQHELVEYLVYDKLHPLPDPWLQTGQICSTVVGTVGARIPPRDFMPHREDHEQEPDEVGLRFELACMAAGANIVDQGDDGEVGRKQYHD